MHCVLTADLACLLSQHGSAVIGSGHGLNPQAIARYWATSRTRFELWHQTLARYRWAEDSGEFHLLRNWWREHISVLEEVLVTEILTRVVAALAAAIDTRETTDEISPITHAVFTNHVEARNRVQKIMLLGRGNSIENAVRLNRIRQTAEQWTDAMIGSLSLDAFGDLQYAFDPCRAAHHGEDARRYANEPSRHTVMWLMNASMKNTLSRQTTSLAVLPEANRMVYRSVVALLPNRLFDSYGTLKSLRMHQIEAGSPKGDFAIDKTYNLDDEAGDLYPIFTPNQVKTARWYQ